MSKSDIWTGAAFLVMIVGGIFEANSRKAEEKEMEERITRKLEAKQAEKEKEEKSEEKKK